MSFTWFKKREKMFLWFAVVFTVFVFATFTGFTDIVRLIEGTSVPDLAGEFTVANSGELRRVGLEEFLQTRRNMGRLFRGLQDVDDAQIWRHLILLEDARAAGIHVAREELKNVLTGGQQLDLARHKQDVLARGFSSVPAYERFVTDFLMTMHWTETLLTRAQLAKAEDVYKYWSVDNERFDFDALVFADRDPATIEDPGDEVLRAAFDALPQTRRDRLYAAPARYDIAYGWLSLDAAFPDLPAEVSAGLEPPTDEEVKLRFERVQAVRFPEATELDESTQERVRAELRIVDLATAGNDAFQAGETRDKAAFLATMERFGLRGSDPEGLLGPEELMALESVGAGLPLRLRGAEPLDTRYVQALSATDTAAQVLFVEAVERERPLSFEEARDRVLENWRKEQAARPAQEFREGLATAARALPDVAAAIAPIEAVARAAAEARASATPDLDDAGRALLLAEELSVVEAQIAARVAESEHLVWDQLVSETDVRLLTLRDVSRNVRKQFGEAGPDPARIEDYLGSSFHVFLQDVNGITDVMRHAASSSSAIVRVRARRALPLEDMLADEEGMAGARLQLVGQREAELAEELQPDALMASHQLRVVQVEQPEGP